MAIQQTNILFYRSANTVGSDICLGGAITATEIPKNQDAANPTFNTILRDFTNAEREDGLIQHKCVFVKNTHATLTATSLRLWFSAVTPDPDTFSRIGLSATGKNAAAVTIPNTYTAPSGVDLDTRHNALDEAIALPDLGPGEYVAFWIRIELRPNAAIYNRDWFQLRLQVTTLP